MEAFQSGQIVGTSLWPGHASPIWLTTRPDLAALDMVPAACGRPGTPLCLPHQPLGSERGPEDPLCCASVGCRADFPVPSSLCAGLHGA